jgi:hypothetical protein
VSKDKKKTARIVEAADTAARARPVAKKRARG